MVQSTAISSSFPASNVLILGQRDAWINDKTNFWLAERGKTAGQGFTLKLDDCARIAGCQIKNLGKGYFIQNMAYLITINCLITQVQDRNPAYETSDAGQVDDYDYMGD